MNSVDFAKALLRLADVISIQNKARNASLHHHTVTDALVDLRAKTALSVEDITKVFHVVYETCGANVHEELVEVALKNAIKKWNE